MLPLASCEQNFKDEEISESLNSSSIVPLSYSFTLHTPQSTIPQTLSCTPRKQQSPPSTSKKHHNNLASTFFSKKKQDSNKQNQGGLRSWYLHKNLPTKRKLGVQTSLKKQLQECTFQPNTSTKTKSLSRSKDITESLYEDALRRQKLREQSPETQIERPSSRSPNAKNKLVVSKFMKQFQKAIGIDTAGRKARANRPEQIDKTLNLNQLHGLLKKLGFVVVDRLSIPCHENELVFQIFEILDGNRESKISANHLFVFLLAITGIFRTENSEQTVRPQTQSRSQKQSHTQSQFGIIVEENTGKLLIGSRLGLKLQQHFNILYRNRLSRQKSQLQKHKKGEGLYAPETSSLSKDLAKQMRNSLLKAKRNSEVRKQTLSSNQKKSSRARDKVKQVERKQEDLSKTKSKEPTRNLNKTPYMLPPLSATRKQASILKTGIKSILVSRDQYNQLVSFGDNNNINNQPFNSKEQQHPSPNFKTYETCHSIDDETEEVMNKLTHRPVLVLEISLDGQSRQLFVYQEDVDCPQQLVENFAQKHDLDMESKYRLYQVLKTSLQQAQV